MEGLCQMCPSNDVKIWFLNRTAKYSPNCLFSNNYVILDNLCSVISPLNTILYSLYAFIIINYV